MNFGDLVPEMNLSTPARRFQATRPSRGDRWTPTRSGGARPSRHVSYYRCVLILPTTVSACELQMSCGGSEARLFPIKYSYIHCVHFSAQCRCATIFSGSKNNVPHRGRFLRGKACDKLDETFFFHYTADVPPHVRILRHSGSGAEI